MKRLFIYFLVLVVVFILVGCSSQSGPSYMEVGQVDRNRPLVTKMEFSNEIVDNTSIQVVSSVQISNNGDSPIDSMGFEGVVNYGEVQQVTALDENGRQLDTTVEVDSNNKTIVGIEFSEPLEPGEDLNLQLRYLIVGAVEQPKAGEFYARSTQLSSSIPRDPTAIVKYTFSFPSQYYYHEAFPNQAKLQGSDVVYQSASHTSLFSVRYGENKKLFSSNLLIYIMYPVVALLVFGLFYWLRKKS